MYRLILNLNYSDGVYSLQSNAETLKSLPKFTCPIFCLKGYMERTSKEEYVAWHCFASCAIYFRPSQTSARIPGV